MPIHVDSNIRVFSQDEFHPLAHRVMGIIFSVHNDFGRLMEEGVYQRTIRRRCEAAGIIPSRREVQITVAHDDFRKPYFMDLLLADEGSSAEVSWAYGVGLHSMDQYGSA